MRKKFTQEQLDFIREIYKKVSIPEIVPLFNDRFNEERTFKQIRAATRNHNMKSGRTGRFEKGNIPHPNARPKGPNKTSFKSGNKPHNWKPVGSSRVSKDGYTEVKTKEPGKWELLHRLIWEKENGKAPRGHAVIFKDGDKSNCDIGNLELVSRGDLAVFNKHGYGDAPPEAKEIVRNICRIKIKLRELEAA